MAGQRYARGVRSPTLLLALLTLSACGDSAARARADLGAASAAMHENDPARALELYERALAEAPRGSDAWHAARWQRLHALAGVDPAAVPRALSQTLQEDSRRVKPLEVFDLAWRMCLLGHEEGLATFEAGMDALGIDALERADHARRLREALALARASPATPATDGPPPR